MRRKLFLVFKLEGCSGKVEQFWVKRRKASLCGLACIQVCMQICSRLSKGGRKLGVEKIWRKKSVKVWRKVSQRLQSRDSTHRLNATYLNRLGGNKVIKPNTHKTRSKFNQLTFEAYGTGRNDISPPDWSYIRPFRCWHSSNWEKAALPEKSPWEKTFPAPRVAGREICQAKWCPWCQVHCDSRCQSETDGGRRQHGNRLCTSPFFIELVFHTDLFPHAFAIQIHDVQLHKLERPVFVELEIRPSVFTAYADRSQVSGKK